jgi:hypothetical protein
MKTKEIPMTEKQNGREGETDETEELNKAKKANLI